MTFFLEFLAAYLASHVLDYGLSFSKKRLVEQLNGFQTDPNQYGWSTALTRQQNDLIKVLKRTKSSSWIRFFIHGPLLKDRPIAFIGPSGAGKTCIALRIAGKK